MEKKALRSGYTTGTCAAGAAKAAARMLRTGCPDLNEICVRVPRGDILFLPVEDIRRGNDFVSCAVRKDSGDDPDVTDGVLVYARVARTAGEEKPRIRIEGGEGVGVVTKPGLDQPVGAAAINSVPRRMIAEAVLAELPEVSSDGMPGEVSGPAKRGAVVTISIPAGRKLAEKTFNPRLGIVGGISVLGTSGIVEPMSDDAMRGTIRAEVSVRRAEGWPVVPVCPGNYGQDFLQKTCGLAGTDPVLASNYIADAMAICAQAGIPRILFAGHVGKLIKVAGGIRNTHSRYGDHRMEILTEFAAPHRNADVPEDWKEKLRECAAMDEAVRLLDEWGIREKVMRDVTAAVKRQLAAFARGEAADGAVPEVEVILFSNVYGILGKSAGAEDVLERFRAWRDTPHADRNRVDGREV